jgi:ankyrin repeat protein
MGGRSQLMIHSYQGSWQIVKLMVNAPDFKESDALEKDSQGLNAMFYAVLGGHSAVVNILLNSICRVLVQETNFENVNCLYIACQNGHKEIVRQF